MHILLYMNSRKGVLFLFPRRMAFHPLTLPPSRATFLAMEYCYQIYETDIGMLTLVSNGESIVTVHFGEGHLQGCRYEEDPLLMEAIFEINQYLFGQRKTFDFPIDPMGNEQEVKLYQYIKQTVPYGKLTNYEKLSEELGIPVDDIVEMLETNSCPIVVPCHRVIRASRRLGPYVTDPEIKNRLIHLEHDHLHDPSLR